VVDIDGAMVDISRKWFGLGDASSLQIHVDDGLKFIRQLAHNGMNQLTVSNFELITCKKLVTYLKEL
jgi:hypothetical protein